MNLHKICLVLCMLLICNKSVCNSESERKKSDKSNSFFAQYDKQIRWGVFGSLICYIVYNLIADVKQRNLQRERLHNQRTQHAQEILHALHNATPGPNVRTARRRLNFGNTNLQRRSIIHASSDPSYPAALALLQITNQANGFDALGLDEQALRNLEPGEAQRQISRQLRQRQKQLQPERNAQDPVIQLATRMLSAAHEECNALVARRAPITKISQY